MKKKMAEKEIGNGGVMFYRVVRKDLGSTVANVVGERVNTKRKRDPNLPQPVQPTVRTTSDML